MSDPRAAGARWFAEGVWAAPWTAWSTSTGNALVDSSSDSGVYRFVFHKK